jgi:hypothetical protein
MRLTYGPLKGTEARFEYEVKLSTRVATASLHFQLDCSERVARNAGELVPAELRSGFRQQFQLTCACPRTLDL